MPKFEEVGEQLGMSGRHFRRLTVRYVEDGVEGLRHHRLGKPSPRRVEAAELARIVEAVAKRIATGPAQLGG